VIARRKSAITEAFYDIGVALTALKKPEMVAALGRRSFAEVCAKDAGLSAVVAERLIGIVRNMTPEQALAMEESDGDDRSRGRHSRSGLCRRALSQEVRDCARSGNADRGGKDGVAATVAKATGVDAETAQKNVIASIGGFATGRFTTPEEVATLVVMLASSRTANVTGSNDIIDGGLIKTT
jgi:hypothetical protein